jgi:4-hydroxy-tetrahydrodipicolinate reductase
MGYDLGVTLESRIDTDCGATVLVDFSVAAAVADRLEEAAGLGLAAVICTTGLDDDSSRRIEAAATRVPVLVAANTSVGITVMRRVAADLSRMLGEDFETHHRFKKDSPSGTALALVDAVAQARAVDPVRDVVHGRQGTSPRRTGEIGVHARRMGDVVGEHTVAFSALGERIELTHRAHSRETFARGALRAAQWLQGRQPGLYTMDDVLAESSI